MRRLAKTCIFIVLLPLALLTTHSGCDKTGTTVIETTADSSGQIITAQDEMNINYEIDQALNEALLATSISSVASGDSTGPVTPAILVNTVTGAVIDISHLNDSALIRITYDGKNADGTKGRTGNIVLQFARNDSGNIMPWKTQGAVINVTLSQYEVIVLATNKSIWMNGTAALTNVSGGQLKSPSNITLPAGSSLLDNVKAYITFTYNDNVAIIVTWAWNIYQNRTFMMQQAALTETVLGDSAGNISTSGTTRLNYPFYTKTLAPVVQSIGSNYLLSNPLSGQKAILGIPEPLTINYGVDSRGNPVTSGAPFGYQLLWIANGGQATVVESY